MIYLLASVTKYIQFNSIYENKQTKFCVRLIKHAKCDNIQQS